VNTIFDVGAHHGKFATSMANIFPNAVTYAFEPYKDSFNELLKNTANKNIIPISKAVCENEGEAILNVNAFEETNSMIDSAITGNATIDNLTKTIDHLQVETTTIAAIAEQYNIKQIDLLKLDIQGSELSALKGADQLLSEKQILFIAAEVEFIEIYSHQPLYHDIANYLTSKNYKLYSIYNIHYDINNRTSWADAIFVSNTIQI
jgi:FkbM family methyltransferase